MIRMPECAKNYLISLSTEISSYRQYCLVLFFEKVLLGKKVFSASVDFDSKIISRASVFSILFENASGFSKKHHYFAIQCIGSIIQGLSRLGNSEGTNSPWLL